MGNEFHSWPVFSGWPGFGLLGYYGRRHGPYHFLTVKPLVSTTPALATQHGASTVKPTLKNSGSTTVKATEKTVSVTIGNTVSTTTEVSKNRVKHEVPSATESDIKVEITTLAGILSSTKKSEDQTKNESPAQPTVGQPSTATVSKTTDTVKVTPKIITEDTKKADVPSHSHKVFRK
ncbi:unnamed protein product [Bursaphelenchus okinawaensis]|uniref:Uncharacterized protein n=1 Tax=Bursaphelenchus okinawaensis TaxID=465554 RepID=A0A811LP14_9BILA|nr:unnamed protein product [Bursaphelenchus okinawaensis]CAG9125240.1 unnamed protein product [Bursaphelenchus okinawaensis]